MSLPLIRGIGEITVGGASTQTSMPVNLPPRKVGDILFIYAQGHEPGGTNVGGPVAPPSATALFSSEQTTGYQRWYAIRVLDTAAALNLQGGAAQNVAVWTTQAWTATNVSPSGMWYDFETDSLFPAPPAVPAVTVNGNNRLVVHFISGSQTGADPGGITGLSGYDTYSDQAANHAGYYFRGRWRSAPTNVTTPFAAYENLAPSYDRIMSISIIGVDDTPLPATPAPNLLSLSCAESYTAFITGPDYRTTIDVVGWSNITWQRVLDEISKASVTVPDVKGGVSCCIPHGGIEPWRFGLVIERNDVPVWNGPITKIERDTEGERTTITAGDVLVRYMKRFAVRADVVNWVTLDAGVALAELINTHARLDSDAWYIPCPSVFTGASVTRQFYPRQLTKAWDVITDLLDSAADAYVSNGVLYVWEPGAGWRYFDVFKRTLDGPYNTNYDFVYGLFTADSFRRIPSWSVDGMSMDNFIQVPSADTGELGFREIWTAESFDSQFAYGVLDHADPNTLDFPENTPPNEVGEALQARANTIRDLHAFPPVVISGGQLAEGAPIDIDNLRPGSIWVMDIFDACYGQLRTASRLKSIDVNVTIGSDGLSEVISPTMFPPGFSKGEQS